MKNRSLTKAKTRREPLYERIRLILESAKVSATRSVNTRQVAANWLIGREIVEEEQKGIRRASYGQQLVERLSERLKADFGVGYSIQNLFYMKQFYLSYTTLLPISGILHALRGEFDNRLHSVRNASASAARQRSKRPASKRRDKVSTRLSAIEILHAPRGEFDWRPGQLHPNLSWTHYRTLLRVESSEARDFYEIESIKNAWSARELERQINSLLFERLAKSKNKAGLMRLAKKGQEIAKPGDLFKDPFVMEFLGLPESPGIVESELEQLLINNLQSFLMELGIGFAFVARQERITLDGDHFYVDLVFYHTILKCYVLIDLKVGRLTHGDLGQIQFYVNYFDQERRTKGDNPTLGLILCTDKNDAVVKYTLGAEQEQKIFARRYQLHLPTVTELRAEIRRELRELGK